jgi:hypothetical protein
MAAGGAFALMALAVGWLLWFQAQRSSAGSPEALIVQAAEVYGQSGDMAQAQDLLADLDANRLAQWLAKMEADAPDEATRQRLVALREALQLPPVTPSLWDSLLSQKLLLISLALAILLLLGALALGLLSTVHQPVEPEAEAEVPPVEVPAEAAIAKEQPGARPQPATVSAQTAPQDAQPAPSVQPTPSPADASQPAADPQMQDILSSVFESEAGAIKYEVLLRELEEIQASDLLATGRRVAQQLRALSASPGDQEGK